MNRAQALDYARRILAEAHIEEARLEGEILLRHVLGISRAELYTTPELDLSAVQKARLDECLARRCQGEPTAYITGHREFYGLDFCVDYRVLIPRPETELLVAKAISLAKESKVSEIADIGTGCGAIAVSLAVHLPQARVYATDISPEALEVARMNIQRHGVAERVTLLCGDLLEPLDKPVDMIVANLPYVKEAELRAAKHLHHEPFLALYGGSDGLETIRRFCRQVKGRLKRCGYLLVEIGAGQVSQVAAILHQVFPGENVCFYPDLAGIQRVVGLRLTALRQGC